MATDEAALDAALTDLGTKLTAIGTSIDELVAKVTVLISKIPTTAAPDLSDEITAIQSMSEALSHNIADVQTAIDAAKPITG